MYFYCMQKSRENGIPPHYMFIYEKYTDEHTSLACLAVALWDSVRQTALRWVGVLGVAAGGYVCALLHVFTPVALRLAQTLPETNKQTKNKRAVKLHCVCAA